MADKPYAFYSLLVATAVLVFALAETVRPHGTGAAAVAARAFLLFALALPVVDALYRNSTGLPLGRHDRRSRPIPIVRRTPIRPPSRPGGSIISTSGFGRTG